MASASKMRRTVRRLIGLPSAAQARLARSPRDWRLKGSCVWATVSHARALTRASSRGGKSGLAPPPRPVLQGEIASVPAPPPGAHRVGMEFDAAPGLDVGERGLLGEQQHQAGPLAQLEADGAAANKSPGLL